MKVGVLIDRLNVGGVEKTAINEVITLRKLGYEAYLLILSRNSVMDVSTVFHDELSNTPIIYLEDFIPKIFRFSFKFPGFAFFSFFHLSYALLLSIYYNWKQYDYILSHSSYTTFTALGAKIFCKVPYFIYFWDPISFIVTRVYKKTFPKPLLVAISYLGMFLDMLLVKNAKNVITAGTTHHDYFKKYCNDSKLVVAHPGVSFYTKSETKNNKEKVLMVTTWKEGKQPEYVFELVKALPTLKLQLLGAWKDQTEKKRFLEKIIRLGFKNNIEIIPRADSITLGKYYKEALVLLTTNLEKGFGMPVLEAAACGTSFIVPNGSGVCSIFQHGVHGYFSEEKNTQEIVKYIQAFLKDKKLAQNLGDKAYGVAKSGFTWEDHIKRITLLF